MSHGAGVRGTGAAAGRARRFLLSGLGLTFAGVAIVATGRGTFGGPVLVAGWGALAFGIHAFGRLGKDAG